MPEFHLAQINIARMRGSRDSPTMAEFIARLDEINALADGAPGFVWRLQDENGNATDIRAFDDDWLIVNMSVWNSVETLKTFVYNSAHNGVMRKRRQWFEPHMQSYFCMWWVPAGHIPTVQEAKERLEHLQTHGESEQAFTWRNIFAPPQVQSQSA